VLLGVQDVLEHAVGRQEGSSSTSQAQAM
jgi:hypothetical protein